jgi:hypothetical protein
MATVETPNFKRETLNDLRKGMLAPVAGEVGHRLGDKAIHRPPPQWAMRGEITSPLDDLAVG